MKDLTPKQVQMAENKLANQDYSHLPTSHPGSFDWMSDLEQDGPDY